MTVYDFIFILIAIFLSSWVIDYKIDLIDKRMAHLESVTFGSSRCLK